MIGSNVELFENSYDSAGRVISITYPGNKTYTYEYDVAGNLAYFKDTTGTPVTVAEYSGFTALGQPTTKKLLKQGGGFVTTTYTYIPETGRLKKLVTEGLSLQNPNLTNLTHTYGYDALNRLLSAQGTGTNPYSQSYTYDRIGNIKTKSDVENGGTYNYSYNNKPHAVRSVGTQGNLTVDYDANGNMTQKYHSGVTTTIWWNYDNKPTSITRGSTTVSFTYDGSAQRVKKISPSQTVFYFGSGYENRNGVGIIHLFAGNQRIASVGTDGITQFYHPDHLGSSWIVTDANGAIKEKNEFYPFGTYLEASEYDPTFPDVNYTFTSQEEDDEVGLYNYNARLYDPVLGRFISPDSLVQEPGDPQTFNRYSYCLNNPLIYTDPSGMFFEWLVAGVVSLLGVTTTEAGIVLTMAAGTAFGAASSAITGGNIAVGAISGFVGGIVGFTAGNVAGPVLAPTVGKGAADTIARYVGAFAGGATSGAINSGAYGGNAWQGALFGGLAAVAVLGTIQGIIELNNWGNSSSGVVLKDPKSGQVRSAEAVVLREAEMILGITDQIKQTAEGHSQITNYVKTFPVEDHGGAMAQQIGDICAAGIGCHRAFDLKANAWKFETNTLHIRSFGDTLVYHWDRFNLTVSFSNFVKHVGVDMIRNTYYAVKELGFWRGLAEGL